MPDLRLRPDLLGPDGGDPRTALFAWDETANEMRGWCFRASAGFAPEPMPSGTTLIPPVPLHPGDSWWAVALRQQASDRALPAPDRDNIGGNLQVLEVCPRL